jgi:hypothetical protein
MPQHPLSLQPDYGVSASRVAEGFIQIDPGLGRIVASLEDDPVALARRLVDALQERRLYRLREAVERLVPLINEAVNEPEITWDWKPAARFIRDWLTDLYGEPEEVYMHKQPGEPLTLNFSMPWNNRAFNDKWDQRKFIALRKKLQRFGLREDPSGEAFYRLPDNTLVVVSLGTGGTPQTGDVRLAGERFSQSLLSRTASMETNVLDGLRKQKVLDIVNRLMEPHTRGMHRDQYWKPIQDIRAAFEREGIPASPVEGSGRYEKEDGVDVRKVWLYEVPFLNQNGRPDKVYVRIVASGAGPVASPLDVYDVVAYAS